MSIKDNYDRDFLFIPKCLEAQEQWKIKGGRYYSRQETVELLQDNKTEPEAIAFIADLLKHPDMFKVYYP